MKTRILHKHKKTGRIIARRDLWKYPPQDIQRFECPAKRSRIDSNGVRVWTTIHTVMVDGAYYDVVDGVVRPCKRSPLNPRLKPLPLFSVNPWPTTYETRPPPNPKRNLPNMA